jgi:excisionase family DNA binding protein
MEQEASLLVDKPEACRMLGDISLRTLDLVLSEGVLPSIKIGRRRMIRRSDLLKFIRSDKPTRGRRKLKNN